MKNKHLNNKILVVDDDVNTLEIIRRNLESKNYEVITATNVNSAINILEEVSVDLVITDLKMPEISGLDLVKHVKDNYKNIEIIMVTGYATIEGAVQAVKSGAEGYLAKPFTDNELFSVVKNAFDKLKTRMAGQTEIADEFILQHNIIGNSKPMKKVFNAINKAAKTNASILITGESGTGKELVARAIHYNSNRLSAPFVPVNCGSIPENLLESELFGYVKGAFTGAMSSRAGFFQTADEGTIFLDEIGETNFSMQVKLLRVLQEQEIYMIGSRKPQKINVRVLSATNKDLQVLIKKNQFREDLFYRINIITIEIPPLRERDEDILLLTNHFANKYAKELGKNPPNFSDEALNILKNYSWAGNVRELQNVIQRLIIMCDADIIDVSDFPPMMRFSVNKSKGLLKTLSEVEADHIKNILSYVCGNKTKASEILGIDRKTLRDKLKKYEINI